MNGSADLLYTLVAAGLVKEAVSLGGFLRSIGGGVKALGGGVLMGVSKALPSTKTLGEVLQGAVTDPSSRPNSNLGQNVGRALRGTARGVLDFGRKAAPITGALGAGTETWDLVTDPDLTPSEKAKKLPWAAVKGAVKGAGTLGAEPLSRLWEASRTADEEAARRLAARPAPFVAPPPPSAASTPPTPLPTGSISFEEISSKE